MPLIDLYPLLVHFILSMIVGATIAWLVAHAVHAHHIRVPAHTAKMLVDYGFFLVGGWLGTFPLAQRIEESVHPGGTFVLTAALINFILSALSLAILNRWISKCHGPHTYIAPFITAALTTVLFILLLLPGVAAHTTVVCWYLQC